MGRLEVKDFPGTWYTTIATFAQLFRISDCITRLCNAGILYHNGQ